MTRRSIFAAGLIVVGVLMLVGGSHIFGVNPLDRGHRSARPSCEQLPDRQAVVDAVASHEDLVERIRAVNSDVTVEIVSPCTDLPDKAIVRITYPRESVWADINEIISNEGFGVPAEVVKD